ncbi:MAG: helix-turn-helix domain-containing protein [Janthinobacterium lividum]
MTHIDWNYWRTFYYVVKAGGFMKAEAYLPTTQSSISCTIQNLERILGKKLLVRRIPNSNTVMTLTPAGASILTQISQEAESFEALNAHVKIKKQRSI